LEAIRRELAFGQPSDCTANDCADRADDGGFD